MRTKNTSKTQEVSAVLNEDRPDIKVSRKEVRFER